MNCNHCGKPLRSDNRTGYCKKHHHMSPSSKVRMKTYEEAKPEQVKKWKRDSQRAAARRRIAKIAEIKLARGCADCGFNKYPEALDFDHLPEHSKIKNISKLATHKWATILEEIAKCDVVC